MAIRSGSDLGQKENWSKKVWNLLGDYGWIGIVVIVLGAAYTFYSDVNNKIIEQTYKVAELNRTIGQLEGKMELILQNKLNCPK